MPGRPMVADRICNSVRGRFNPGAGLHFFNTKSTCMSDVKMLYHGIYFCDEVFFVKTLPFPSPKNGEEILQHYTDIGEIPFTRACRSVLWVGINYLIVRTHIY